MQVDTVKPYMRGITSSAVSLYCNSNIYTVFHRLLSAASSTFAAFVIGALGSVAGTLVAWLLLGTKLGPDGWKVSTHLFAALEVSIFWAHVSYAHSSDIQTIVQFLLCHKSAEGAAYCVCALHVITTSKLSITRWSARCL